MSGLWEPLLDSCVPSPDPVGALADLQIRRHDWAEAAQHIHAEWPAVRSIRCSFSGMRPSLNIAIAPWTEESRFQHWQLADWLRETLPLTDCDIHVLPHVVGRESTWGVELFPRFASAVA